MEFSRLIVSWPRKTFLLCIRIFHGNEFHEEGKNLQDNISVYPVKVSSAEDVIKLCAKIGTDSGALSYLVPKANIIHIYAERVDYRAANFVKQEMLSRGGDCAVGKHVIDGKTDYSDILIIGAEKQIASLTEKMTAMNIWGIPALREKIAGIMRNIKRGKWEIISPNGRKIILGRKTRLMAILNLTPDSFHPESRTDERGIIERAGKFLDDGAYILDVGAESTRPGASPVSESDEAGRLLPALRALRREFPEALISVDTYKAEIARLSAGEGADIINDISGFNFDSDMAGTIAGLGIPYVLSHITGTPSDMAGYESHENILGEMDKYFAEKLSALESAGVKRENVILDPGLGFGKSAGDNFTVLKNIESLAGFGLPVMIGHSRKRFTGGLSGTLGVTAMMSGRVSLLRVHDVAGNMEALRVAEGINGA